MGKRIVIMALAVGFLTASTGISQAKFSCTVEAIDGNRLILKDCNQKGLKKLKAGATVSITKKRRKLEGC